MPGTRTTARRTRTHAARFAALGVVAALVGALATAQPAQASAPAARPLAAPAAAPHANAPAVSHRPAPLTPLSSVDPGPDGSARPATTGSPALTPIAPLPALDPGPDDAPTVPEAAVPQNLPVTPSSITLATTPGQTLVDQTAADALDTMGAAGPYVTGGHPALDANKLQPQVASAQFVDPAAPATLQQLTDALLSGNLPPSLPVDALALLQKLPNGIPQITYRLCSESVTKPVSCSTTLPLGVPALLNVTGNGTAGSPDRTPDVLADLVPAVSLDSIVTASKTLLSDQGALAAAKQSLTDLVKLLLDPLYLLKHPDALAQKLNLQNLIASLEQQVQADIQAIISMVNVGLGLLSLRLPTSEVPTSQPLPAHVWAVYDIPGYHRLSVGFDGFRRGTGLSKGTLGIFTFNPGEILQGIYDVHAEMYNGGPASALAITAGISSITQDSAGTAFDPTVASARFSPVPFKFSAHALIDPTTETDTVDALVSNRSQLDALIFSNRTHASPADDQYTELKIDTLPNTVTATLHRPTSGGSTTVTYRASDTIDDVLFANYQYSGATLQHALQATAHAVPASIDLGINTGGDQTTLSYTASSSLQSLGLGFYDQSSAISGATGPIVVRGALTALPTTVTGLIDQAAKHVQIDANPALGSASLQASFKLGDYAPLPGDHATYIGNGKAFGVDARISGFQALDAWFDDHLRVNTTFFPAGQPLTAAAIIDGTTKIRADVSNLPVQMSIDLNPANRTADYHASSVIHDIRAAYVNTTNGPSILGHLTELPQSVHANWDLGSAPHVRYEASSGIPLAELFVSPTGIETVAAQADEYLSVAVHDIPTILDVVVDFENKHVEGNSSGPIGRIEAAARFPFAGDEWTATGELDSVPASFTVDFADGNYDFHALSGPLGRASLTVSNHPNPVEPTSPAHLAVHYNEVTGDLDASAAIINLTEVGYQRSAAGQKLTLQADEGGNPLQLDANILLKADGVADTALSALGSITGLPSKLNITMADGKITYTTDKHVGIELGIRVGKVKALAGLGAPLPANGIAAVAKSCAVGPGCAQDSTPFCLSTTKCVGAVANINLTGLPTTVTVDSNAGTVAFTGYQPPISTLVLYVRLIGLIDALPDVSARATLSGLPSSLDFTAGPFTLGTGDPTSLDAQYHGSAPLGALSVDVNATTTDPTFPLLRANAAVAGLPADFHLTGSLGTVSHVTVDNSAPIDLISATVTNASSGYLQASLQHVPAKMDYLVNLSTSHAEATMSSAIDAITVLAHVPHGGRTWSAFAQATGIPGHFTADFGAGSFGFHALSGPLGSATFAVTNHSGATVPDLAHYLAAHYDQLSGNIDGGARITDLSAVSYGKNASGDQTFDLDMGAATVGLDADVVLAANGARDTRFSAGGTITTPNAVHIDLSNSHIVYHSDQSAALRLTAAVGKVKALAGLGAPLYSQGVGVRAAACSGGAGCANDSSLFCSVFSSCFGAVANVVLPGLPTKVDIDTSAGTVNLVGLHPTGTLKVFAELDGLLGSTLPRVRALATISGLPSVLDLNVGPFGADPADPTKFRAGYSASAGLGHLQVDADADTTTSLGQVRGQLIASNLPKSVSVTGQFGSQNHVDVIDPGGIGDLRVQATATLLGSPGSALVDFTDIPGEMHMDVGSADTGDGVNAPEFTYTSPANTLDGLVQVDAQLSQNVGPASVGTDGAFFRFTNLGGDTKVRLNPSSYHLNLTSVPSTDSFQLGLNIQVGDIPNQNFSQQIFDFLATQGYVEGHYGMRPSHIGDIELDIENLHSMLLQPGTAPFGLPAEVGLLFPGVTGDYGTFSMNMFDVDVNPDVYVKIRVNDPIGDDHTLFEYSLPSHIDSFVFHKYDMNGPADIFTVSFVGLVCFNVTQNPEPAGKSANGVTLNGSDGPQTFNFIDYNDELPDVLVNVLSAYMSPFGHSFDYNVDGC